MDIAAFCLAAFCLAASYHFCWLIFLAIAGQRHVHSEHRAMKYCAWINRTKDCGSIFTSQLCDCQIYVSLLVLFLLTNISLWLAVNLMYKQPQRPIHLCALIYHQKDLHCSAAKILCAFIPEHMYAASSCTYMYATIQIVVSRQLWDPKTKVS